MIIKVKCLWSWIDASLKSLYCNRDTYREHQDDVRCDANQSIGINLLMNSYIEIENFLIISIISVLLWKQRWFF